MHAIVAACLLLALPVSVLAQQATPRTGLKPGQRNEAHRRIVTVMPGAGNSMGVVGVQVERYFSDDRFSAFGALGYSPAFDSGDPTGVAGAAGLRAYTPGRRHRGFLELSGSEVAIQTGANARLRYGPGLQAGYQYTGLAGFTAMVSVGGGYVVGARDGVAGSRVVLLSGLGIGYTWRR